MNASELWETTMNPARRVLLQVTLDDAAQADELFSVLMGEDVEATAVVHPAQRQGREVPRHLTGSFAELGMSRARTGRTAAWPRLSRLPARWRRDQK